MTPPEPTTAPAYAELHCLSNFSFQRGHIFGAQFRGFRHNFLLSA